LYKYYNPVQISTVSISYQRTVQFKVKVQKGKRWFITKKEQLQNAEQHADYQQLELLKLTAMLVQNERHSFKQG